MGIIVAIGGYAHENWRKCEFDTPISIDREIVKLASKKPHALFVPTGSSDSEGYMASWLKVYRGKLGCKTDALRLVTGKPSHKEIQAKIDWADIIYVGGGNTPKMMKKWRRLGFDKVLKRAYEQGKILCGVSAGSICWFEYGVSDSLHFYNAKETKYIKVRGLGLLKGTHNPHFGSKTKDNKYRTKGMKEVMKRSKGECLAIPDGCAVIFSDYRYRVIGKSDVSQIWYERGDYNEVKIPRGGEVHDVFSPLVSVLVGKGKLLGKGVFANRDFKKGEIVIQYKLKPLTKGEYRKLPKSEKMFTHTHWGQIYLYSEPERYVNHSSKPNTKPDLISKCDIATKDIRKGQMVTTNSRMDDA